MMHPINGAPSVRGDVAYGSPETARNQRAAPRQIRGSQRGHRVPRRSCRPRRRCAKPPPVAVRPRPATLAPSPGPSPCWSSRAGRRPARERVRRVVCERQYRSGVGRFGSRERCPAMSRAASSRESATCSTTCAGDHFFGAAGADHRSAHATEVSIMSSTAARAEVTWASKSDIGLPQGWSQG